MKRNYFFKAVLTIYSIFLLTLTACASATPIPVPPSIESTLPTAIAKPPTPLPLTDETAFILAGQLGGTVNAVALDGDIAYAGIGTRLVTVDISDPTTPRFIGQSDALPNVVEAVVGQGGIAYVAANGDFHIYDVSNPATLVRVNTLFDLAGPDKLSKADTFLAGELVYVKYRFAFPGGASLIAVNVSEPAQPVIVNRLDLAVTAAVAVSDEVLYVANEGQLQLFDAAVPGNKLGESALEFRLSNTPWQYFLAVVGDLAYVSVTQQPLQVWDVRDPAQPVRVSAAHVDLPVSDTVGETDGEALFLVDISNGNCNAIVRVMDVADPTALHYRAESEPSGCISDIAVGDDILVATTEGGLLIFDHGDPARLPAVGHFVHRAGFDMVYNVALNGNLAYVILGHGDGTRLGVLDRTQPTAPMMVGEPLGLALMQGCGVHALYVRVDRLYVVPGCGSMLMVDISESAKPRPMTYRGEGIGEGPSVPDSTGNLLYTRIGDELGVVDINDPASPVILAVVSTWPEGLCDLSVTASYLIAASCAGSTKVLYDLSDPLRPLEVGRLDLRGQFDGYAVAGDTFFYVSTDTNTLIALDISDPAQAMEIGRLILSSSTYKMVPVEDTLFLFMEGSIWALSINDRAHPYLEWNLPLSVNDFGVDGDLVYLAAGEAGLLILRDEE